METTKMTLKEARACVKNTKYIVWSKDESIQLQKKLFEIGCEWYNRGTTICHTDCPFLFIDENLDIRYLNKKFYESFAKSQKNYKQTDSIISIEIEQPKEEPKPKFDPNTLQPFDKVLVRQNEESIWIARFFEYYEICSCGSYHTTSGSTWKYCIPFNDDTKHLHRNCDKAPEFYQV